MTPSKLSKTGTEHGEQVALFAWANMAYWHGFKAAFDWDAGTFEVPSLEGKTPALPFLKYMHAVPNGGSRGDSQKSQMIVGGQMKAEGVKRGVPDVFLPYPANGWHGLYIEMKKPSLRPKRKGTKGGLSDDQIEYRDYLLNAGFGWRVCYSWKEAAETITAYVEWGQHNER